MILVGKIKKRRSLGEDVSFYHIMCCNNDYTVTSKFLRTINWTWIL